MQAAVEMMVMVTMWKCFRCWRRTTWTRWTCWHTSDLTVRRPVMLAAMTLIYCRCFHSCPTTLSCWDLRQNRRRCPTWTSRRCFRCGRSNSRTVAVDAKKTGYFLDTCRDTAQGRLQHHRQFRVHPRCRICSSSWKTAAIAGSSVAAADDDVIQWWIVSSSRRCPRGSQTSMWFWQRAVEMMMMMNDEDDDFLVLD